MARDKLLKAHTPDHPMCFGGNMLCGITAERPAPINNLVGQSSPNDEIVDIRQEEGTCVCVDIAIQCGSSAR